MNSSSFRRFTAGRLTVAIAAAAAVGVFLSASTQSYAAMLASDNAANYSATSGATNLWPNGTTTFDGGQGFGGWTFNNQNPSTSYAGEYLAIPSYTWPTAESIASGGGYLWGLYSGGQSTGNVPSAAAYRAFENSAGTGLGTLRSGQTFSVAAAVRTNNNALGIGTTGEGAVPASIGVGLLTFGAGGNTSVWNVSFSELPANTGGNTTSSTELDTTVTDANGVANYIQGVSAQALSINGLIGGVNLAFSLGANNAYTFTISPAAGNTALSTPLTYTGTISGSINGVGLFDSMSADDAIYNNMAITPSAATPEPAGLALLAMGLGAGIMLSRRRTR